MEYALVIKNKIENVGYLPSQFAGIPEPQLKTRGWYKVVKDSTVVKEYETFVSNYSYDSKTDIVTEVKLITRIPLLDYQNKKYKQISEEIKAFILETYPDYKQMSAALGLYDAATSNKIKAYVGKYLAIALSVKTFIFTTSKTHAEVETAYFRKPVLSKDGMTILSYTYWV